MYRITLMSLFLSLSLSLSSVSPDDRPAGSKRRRSSSNFSSLITSPPTSSFKPPLTERQQLALLKQISTSPGTPLAFGMVSNFRLLFKFLKWP